METTMKLRLSMDSLAKPSAIESNDRLNRFVEVRRVERRGGVHFEVDLNILDSYYTTSPAPENRVTVTREMVGELFDVLGIFPRSEKPPVTLAQAETELQFISEKLEAIHGIAVEVYGSVSEQRLKQVEDILKDISLVKHKTYLLLELSRAQ